MLDKLLIFLKNIAQQVARAKQKQSYTPAYRIVELTCNEEDDYIATVQIINKNLTFKAKPEELLARDNIVDLFSPRDVKALTYLGYLGINSPKYKILAKRLSEKHDKVVFALKKRGKRNPLLRPQTRS